MVLDGSNSIYPWESIVHFVLGFLNKTDVGPELTQVSVKTKLTQFFSYVPIPSRNYSLDLKHMDVCRIKVVKSNMDK